jgi:hypothetical protein
LQKDKSALQLADIKALPDVPEVLSSNRIHGAPNIVVIKEDTTKPPTNYDHLQLVSIFDKTAAEISFDIVG